MYFQRTVCTVITTVSPLFSPENVGGVPGVCTVRTLYSLIPSSSLLVQPKLAKGFFLPLPSSASIIFFLSAYCNVHCTVALSNSQRASFVGRVESGRSFVRFSLFFLATRASLSLSELVPFHIGELYYRKKNLVV